jgi:hypothetical protein
VVEDEEEGVGSKGACREGENSTNEGGMTWSGWDELRTRMVAGGSAAGTGLAGGWWAVPWTVRLVSADIRSGDVKGVGRIE